MNDDIRAAARGRIDREQEAQRQARTMEVQLRRAEVIEKALVAFERTADKLVSMYDDAFEIDGVNAETIIIDGHQRLETMTNTMVTAAVDLERMQHQRRQRRDEMEHEARMAELQLRAANGPQ